MCKERISQFTFFTMSMPMDTAFQSAAEQGRRVLTRGQINQVLSARSARKFPYSTYGRKVYLRGTARGVAKYGTSYRTATPMQRQQRSMDGIIGSGAYGLASAGRSLGARVGRYLGNKMGRTGLGDLGLAGQRLGQFAGGMAGSALSARITGSGSYTQTNSLFNKGMDVPQFATAPGDETGALHITHTEYVQDILGTTAFTNQAFPINPGDPGVFPWLSQLAANYDEFEFSGLMFHYKSVSGDLSTASVQLGTIIMATNYNAGAPLFSSKQTMMEYSGASRVKVSDDLTCGVECDKNKGAGGGIMYVAVSGTVPDGQDVKTYFPGVFQIATNQCASTVQVGELWVSYKVCLRKPKLTVSSGSHIYASGLRAIVSSALLGVANSLSVAGAGNGYFNNLEDLKYDSTSAQTGGSQISGGVLNSQSLGFTPTLNNIGWNFTANTANAQVTYTFPPWLQQGTFQFTIYHGLFSTWSSAPVFTTSGGVSVVASENNANFSTFTVALSSSYSGTGVVHWVRITQGGTFTWTTSTVMRFNVNMINPAVDSSNAEV